MVARQAAAIVSGGAIQLYFRREATGLTSEIQMVTTVVGAGIEGGAVTGSAPVAVRKSLAGRVILDHLQIVTPLALS